MMIFVLKMPSQPYAGNQPRSTARTITISVITTKLGVATPMTEKSIAM